MSNKFISLIWLLIFKFSYSQTINISLDYFNIFEYNNQVFVDITLSPGNTCNGIKLWRSTDSLNFIEVVYLDGVCGNSSSSTNYSLVDSSPILNSLNYYKVQYGSNILSEIYEILVLDFKETNFQIWPNPANDFTTFYFKNPLAELYLFNFYNFSGEKLTTIYTRKNNLLFDCKKYFSGVYLFTLSRANNNHFISGKMIINHL